MACGGVAIAGLTCDGVAVRIADRSLLEGVDLVIEHGRICVLLGESGAGKTTLLRAIAGLVALDEGDVRLDGASVRDLPVHRRGVAMLFQEPRLFPSLSVVDNVSYAGRAAGQPRAARRRHADELLGAVGLAGRATSRTTELSGGEQQRVALARALFAAPRVLLLDEPLSAVDGPRRVELRDLLRRIQRGFAVTTLLVTHDLADAVALGDEIAVMTGGRIAQRASPDEVLRRPTTPEVARLTGNPNRVVGASRGGVVHVGSCRFPLAGPDGPTEVTIRPEHVELRPGGIAMAVTDMELRVANVRVLLDGPIGPIEALFPNDGRRLPSAAGDVVEVGIPLELMWRFPDRSAVDEHGGPRG